ncbi:hypothetical protein D6833_04975 [Candidatus Parcubacteria bacterium]|nr:MAG: hypothetical protein D6833_04975 [Candidatus Parcubacteria bacterium]
MRLPRYGKIAAKAVKQWLDENYDPNNPPLLATVSVKADQAAFEAGRKSELFDYLDPYAWLLPEGFTTMWIGDANGGLLCVVRREDRKLHQQHRVMAGPFDVAVDFGPQEPAYLPQ